MLLFIEFFIEFIPVLNFLFRISLSVGEMLLSLIFSFSGGGFGLPGLLDIFFIVSNEEPVISIEASSERCVGLGTEAEMPFPET